MIEILNKSKENVLLVKVTGKLTVDDYEDVFIPKLNELIDKYGKVKVLIYMPEEFKGWTLGAMWDDAKFGFRHRKDLEKIAIVGGAKWIQWGTKVSSHLMKGQIKTFWIDELQTGINWINKL